MTGVAIGYTVKIDHYDAKTNKMHASTKISSYHCEVANLQVL